MPKYILKASEKSISLIRVSTKLPYSKKPLIQNIAPDMFLEELSKLKERISEVRILLDAPMAYVFTLEINDSELPERTAIKEKLRTLVPEDLDLCDWDYVLKEKGIYDVLIPVPRLYKPLVDDLKLKEIEITAVETESYAEMRNKDPVVGLALKKDLAGPDSQVFNISSIKPRDLSWLKYGFGLVVLGIVIAAAYTTLLYVTLLKKTTQLPSVASTKDVSYLEIKRDSFDTPDTSQNLSTLAFQVLNGSGIAGEASRMQAALVSNSITNVAVGNAFGGSYVDTSIRFKSSLDSLELLNSLEALLPEYNFYLDETLPEDSVYDVVITIGRQQ